MTDEQKPESVDNFTKIEAPADLQTSFTGEPTKTEKAPYLFETVLFYRGTQNLFPKGKGKKLPLIDTETVSKGKAVYKLDTSQIKFWTEIDGKMQLIVKSEHDKLFEVVQNPNLKRKLK